MDVDFAARGAELSEKFKEAARAKLAKADGLAPDARLARVVASRRRDADGGRGGCGVEITVFAGEDCVRAAASSKAPDAAFDLALEELLERLRKFRGAGRRKKSEAAPDRPSDLKAEGGEGSEDLIEAHLGEAVFEVRRKIYSAAPMDVDEAIYEMELLGHDFFLFVDKETGNPSCLYRRHAMSYGVLELKKN